ncbi:MAG: hypothetical protein ACE5GQ_11755 [Nitrospinales bacterium]
MPEIKPPTRPTSSKGSPPPIEKPSMNLTRNPSNKSVALNFYVENEFRRAYKSFAVEHDMTMVELLKRSFQVYKDQLEN